MAKEKTVSDKTKAKKKSTETKAPEKVKEPLSADDIINQVEYIPAIPKAIEDMEPYNTGITISPRQLIQPRNAVEIDVEFLKQIELPAVLDEKRNKWMVLRDFHLIDIARKLGVKYLKVKPIKYPLTPAEQRLFAFQCLCINVKLTTMQRCEIMLVLIT